MWKWLHPYAKSERLYHLLRVWYKYFLWIGVVLIGVGSAWGLLFAPEDYQQGNSFRIIYVHVPAAIWSMGVYFTMAVSAFIAIVWQIKQAHWAMIAMAPVGIVYTVLALVSGAVWGKPTWGTWWVWDARLTSELILLFLYIGVLTLYHAFEDRIVSEKTASILALIGIINLPIIHFSVEWWHTLHQGATITKFAAPSIAAEMLWPLLINIVGFACLFGGVAMQLLRTQILEEESQRKWVKILLTEERSIK